MKTRKQSYPYPVLDERGDVEGIFNPAFVITKHPFRVEAEYEFNLSNKTLEELVKKGSARFVVEMECKTTFFRRTYQLVKPKGIIELPAERVRGKVEVGFYLCAIEPVKKYRPEGLHKDYGDVVFQIESGDILADGGRGFFEADKKFDPLRAPASSFMRIGRAAQRSRTMYVDYDEDMLIVRLPDDLYEKYRGIKGAVPFTSGHGLLAFPALAEALRVMRDKQVEYGERTWFTRLESICREQKINPDEPVEAAQKILDNPLIRSMEEIDKTLFESDEEDYE